MNQYVTGAVIKELREKNKMTQLQLADKLGVSDKTVSKWETGKGYPDITLLESIADVFSVSVTELISGNTVQNSNVSANVLKSKFYICPICGNVSLESTTSGLLSEVQRLLSIAYENNELPRFLLLENVKNLVGKKFIHQFNDWVQWLNSIGYNTYYKVEPISGKDAYLICRTISVREPETAVAEANKEENKEDDAETEPGNEDTLLSEGEIAGFDTGETMTIAMASMPVLKTSVVSTYGTTSQASMKVGCAGYAKYETFPIWNIPLKHPVNLAYEAATADLNDVNMIDPFHLEAYGKISVNYNRDIEIFPVLNALFEGIYGESPYKSPTDMGVNMIGFCMSDEDVCCNAARDEIIRRHYYALCNLAEKGNNESEVNKIALILKQAKLTTDYRRTTVAAHDKKELSGVASAAIELQDGTIITSRSSALLGPSAALILNATKHLAGIPHEVKLIPEELISPIQKTKVEYLHGKNPRLHTDEVLVALSLLSNHDENCRKALDQLPKLYGCQVHSTVMLSEVDQKIFKKLGVGLTCDPVRKIE